MPKLFQIKATIEVIFIQVGNLVVGSDITTNFEEVGNAQRKRKRNERYCKKLTFAEISQLFAYTD